jgi:AraC family transcriptional regulator of adaptative response/methylated-DNA-[protein]-cysteine methyltransferase
MGALDENACWDAVVARDASRDGELVYAVLTTGVFCRPSCGSRRPRRENVRFFADGVAAEAAGYRACRRCRPTSPVDPHANRIAALCAFIRERVPLGEPLGLAELSRQAGLSEGHLQRVFRATVGVSPRQFVEACRLAAVKADLRAGESVTDAIYGAGFGSASRLYEKVDGRLGMTPRAYRQGGEGLAISHAVLDCPAGRLLLGATDRGLCFVALGDDAAALRAALVAEFPRATIAPSATPPTPELEGWRTALAAELSGAPGVGLPLDVRATAFQYRVWSYLQTIPRGATRSYGEVAAAIGEPRAVRAVARACACNPTAVVVPCHRVIRGDGGLGGYRWGDERKARLLAAEGASAASGPPLARRERGPVAGGAARAS